jgi:RND family efflux transporter MFP subunit
MAAEDLSKLRIDVTQRAAGAGGKGPIKRIGWWAVAGCLGAVTLVVLVWSGLLSPAMEVSTVRVSRTLVSRALTVLNASGYVVAQRKAAVSSKATGRLARLFVEEGRVVKKGDVIASLENDDLMATLDETKAGLSVAEALLKDAQAELEDATLQYNRQQALRQSGSISEQAWDAAEARFKKAVAREKSSRFGVERARASVKVAEVNLEYSFIRAPFDGVILTKFADEGEVVAPFGAAVNAKAAVVTMADMESLLVEVDVSESSIEKVKVGGASEIRLDALPNDRFPGTVHMIVPTADRSKATVLTKVKFERLDERVLPEMSAKVAFLARPLGPDEKEPFLGVPRTAVRNSPGGKTALLVENGRVRAVGVKTGREWPEMIEIVSGLKEGDIVVLDASEKIADRARVKTKE